MISLCALYYVRGRSQDKHLNHYDTPELQLKTQSVPRSKHSASIIKTSQLMLYREIMAVCSEIHTIYINTVCEQSV